MKIILIALIRLYKLCVSPLLGSNCRHYPSCSTYALEAMEKLPVHRALGKIINRILRCNPWSRGGFDPVIKQE